MKVFDRRAHTPPVSRLILSSRNRPKRDARLARDWCWLERRLIEVSQGSRNAVSDSGWRWRIGFQPRVGLGTQDSDEGLKCRRLYAERPGAGRSRAQVDHVADSDAVGTRLEPWT